MMNRRRFIGSAIAGGAGLAAGCTPGDSPDSIPEGTSVEVGPFEFDEITVRELQEGMESGRLTARSIAELYLDRIEALDRAGPGLRSVIEINPQAGEIADQLDEERRAGNVRGRLHGVPVLIKDNMVQLGERTGCASRILENFVSPYDGAMAERFEAAGAVILGRTNMDEFAMGSSTENSIYGPAHNPWDAARAVARASRVLYIRIKFAC